MSNSTGDSRLVPVRSASDVMEAYRNTPIEDLLGAQNLDRPFPVGEAPTLFVATCIDSRLRLRLPPGAAFELRAAGVHLTENALFQIAFAVSVVGIRHIAIISHEDCAMASLRSRRESFVRGLTLNSEWDETSAEKFFGDHSPFWHKEDPVASVLGSTRELRARFPDLLFAPLHYSIANGHLSQIREDT